VVLDGNSNTLELDGIGSGDVATATGTGNLLSFEDATATITVNLSSTSSLGVSAGVAIMGGMSATLSGFSLVGITAAELAAGTFIGTTSDELIILASGSVGLLDTAFANSHGIPELGFSDTVTTVSLSGGSYLAASGLQTINLSTVSATAAATIDL